MADLSNCGKFIRTFKGNLLCCIEVSGKPFFFYMNPKTGLRFVSGHERKRGNYNTQVEWDWALQNWEGAKAEELSGRDLANAKTLGPHIADDFTFNMSMDDVAALPKNHARKF